MANPTARADQFYPLQGEYGWDDKNIIANGITNASLAANTIGNGQVSPNLIQTISYTPTNAAFVTAYDLGIIAIPAVANKTIVPLSCLLRYVYGVHAFTSGGAIQLQWDTTTHAGGTTALTTVAASVVLATASSDTMMQQAATTTTAVQGKALCVANATQDFAIAAGNTSSVTFIIQYVVV